MKDLTILNGEMKMVASDEREFKQLCCYIRRSFDHDKSFDYFAFDLDYSIYIRFNQSEDPIVNLKKLRKEFESLIKKD